MEENDFKDSREIKAVQPFGVHISSSVHLMYAWAYTRCDVRDPKLCQLTFFVNWVLITIVVVSKFNISFM